MRRPISQIASLTLLLTGCNMLTVKFLLGQLGLELEKLGSYQSQQLNAALWTIDIWLLVMIGVIAWRKIPLGGLFKQSILVNLFSLGAGILLLLALNPLLASRWLWPSKLLIIAIFLLLSKAFHLLFVKEGGPQWTQKFSLPASALYGLFTLMLILEFLFTWIGKPQLNDNSLASKVWFRRNWQVNSLGYREHLDYPHIEPQRRQLLFIGDSFLAGHGVRDPQNRFSNTIQGLLGPSWQVHNHGQNGAGTLDEVEQFWNEPPQPEITVLCWFLNDIHPSAQAMGYLKPANTSMPSAFDPMHHSFLLNYLYWNFPSSNSSYLEELQLAFADSRVMDLHFAELTKVKEAASERGSNLLVVLFPLMNHVNESEFAMAPLRAFWKDQGIPCLDLRPKLMAYPPEELIVNNSDTHPNEVAHKVIAMAIAQFIAPFVQSRPQ